MEIHHGLRYIEKCARAPFPPILSDATHRRCIWQMKFYLALVSWWPFGVLFYILQIVTTAGVSPFIHIVAPHLSKSSWRLVKSCSNIPRATASSFISHFESLLFNTLHFLPSSSMNKTSKELDLSSVITQVSKDTADQLRSGPPTTPAVASGTAATTNGPKSTQRTKTRRRNSSFRPFQLLRVENVA